MKKLKRILAILGIIVLLSLYVISFVAAIMSTEQAHTFFVASIVVTVALPIVLYGYILIHKFFTRDKFEYIDDSETSDNNQTKNK